MEKAEKKEKDFCVGLFGCGIVGRKVAELLLENEIYTDIGQRIVITKIYTKSPQGPKSIELYKKYPDIFVKTSEDIIQDNDISAIIETTGTEYFAEQLIKWAHYYGKHVVTANKALLAKYPELFALAKEKGLQLKFEAAVAGEVPIIRTLDNCFKADEILEISGILNGTTNYLLEQMQLDGNSGEYINRDPFENILKKAQRLGFAEADVSDDVSGTDSANKLALLIGKIFDVIVFPEKIYTQGIENITIKDIEYASSILGKKIKLIASARKEGDQIIAHVFPALINENDILAKIDNAINSVKIRLKNGDELSFSGPGAGGVETANSVIDDVVKIANDTNCGCSSHRRLNAQKEKKANDIRISKLKPLRLKPFDDCVFQHTLRFTVKDSPMIMGILGTILGKRDINLKSFQQCPTDDRTKLLFLISTDPCEERIIQKAVKEINKQNFVIEPVLVFRSLN